MEDAESDFVRFGLPTLRIKRQYIRRDDFGLWWIGRCTGMAGGLAGRGFHLLVRGRVGVMSYH